MWISRSKRAQQLLAVVFIAVMLFPNLSAAEPLDDVAALYIGGSFIEAARQAEAIGTADAFAYAARSLLSAATTGPRDKSVLDYVERAEQAARAAISLDPDHVEGNIQLALSLGLIGRHTGRLRAHFRGYARDGKEHLDRAFSVAPENSWVLSVLGGWHLEIVDRAGRKSAEWLYQADEQTGIDYYEAALKVDPGNIAIRHQFGLQLAALGKEEHVVRARDVLAPIEELVPSDAFSGVMAARALELLDAVRSGEKKRIKKLCKLQKSLY